ncbi:MAG: VCBS repeat-containing protein [Armatimonadota bacterium]|nr:VCBS repeat-containing protein [Armatimonadota bacterium]
MRKLLATLAAAAALLSLAVAAVGAAPQWVSPDHYRKLLTVDCRGRDRSNSPVAVNLNFPQELASQKAKGSFDVNTVEVVAHDSSGKPRVFDSSRQGYEKYILPHRIDRYYGVSYVTLNFVLPDETANRIAVYFDTKESKLGKPKRYPGLVGDGDYFRIEYSRREVGASQKDDFCDFDGDGDLDLIKVTVEPFLYFYENVGGNKFVERGKMTSGGSLFMLPMSDAHRSWAIAEFADWDDDGDQDIFITFNDGTESGQMLTFENVTKKGGQLTFANRGRLLTKSGQSLGDAWFGTAAIVDWDGDGKKDLIAGRGGFLEFRKNIGASKDMRKIEFADAVNIQANGEDIKQHSVRAECADIDNDGDLDMFVACFSGQLYYYKNIGTRTTPKLAAAVGMPAALGGHLGVKVADFDGDGLLDYVTSQLWEGQLWGEGEWSLNSRMYARMHKNVGTKTEPKFEERTALNGAPYTEQFQICDAMRQSGIRTADWNGDRKMDLAATTDGGQVFYFRGLTNSLFPVFAAEERVLDDLGPFCKSDVCDWNNDGKEDIIVANGRGWLTLFLNEGTPTNLKLGQGERLSANGKLISGTGRGSVLVCDWDNDGKKDIIFGMAGDGHGEPAWPVQNEKSPTRAVGFLFYKNIGTDAGPVLDYPKWIKAGWIEDEMKVITFTRPNLGAYVDWDGDGKKDFIMCEFENVIRLYKNSEYDQSTGEPKFIDDVEGHAIVQPWTVQLISGVEVIDWNGDGDLDIVTGQGHGGTGIRFYERDYIEDSIHDLHPVVIAGNTERKN